MSQVLGRVLWQEMRREIMAVALWREIVAGTVAIPWPEVTKAMARVVVGYAAGDAATMRQDKRQELWRLGGERSGRRCSEKQQEWSAVPCQ